MSKDILWLLIPLLITAVVAVIEAYFDARTSLSGKSPEHGISAAVRILFAIVFSLLFIDVSYISVGGLYTIKGLYFIIMLIIYSAALDPFFNLFKHGYSKMWTIHKPDPVKGAVTDKIAYKLMGENGQLYLRTKLSIVLFLGIVIYMTMDIAYIG